MAFAKKGDSVRQITVPIVGKVTRFEIDQESGERLLCVEWTDDAEVVHTRFFKDAEVEVQPEVEAEAS